MMSAPKIIWSLWLQGEAEAPELVRLCLRSWRERNPGWEVRVLDRGCLADWLVLDPAFAAHLETATPQACSDLVRMRLLARHGGVWADATVFCRAPLDTWLWKRLESGFFAFSAPGPDRLVSSWFLAARMGDPLVRAWQRETARYWSGPAFRNASHPRLARRLGRLLGAGAGTARLWCSWPIRHLLRLSPYHWLHYLFAEAIRHDAEAAAVWTRTPRVSADGPHRLQSHGLDRPADPSLRLEIEAALQPLYKLDLRRGSAALGAGGVLDLLIGL